MFTLDSQKIKRNQSLRFLPTKEAVSENPWIG
jgi:hypothetical protein